MMHKDSNWLTPEALGIAKKVAIMATGAWVAWLFLAPFTFLVLRALKKHVLNIPGLNWQGVGQLGDMFGGFNALLNCFVLVGVAVAASIQNRQLTDARTALQDERLDAAHQAFDSYFFALLNLTRDIADRLGSNQLEKGPQMLEQWGLEVLNGLKEEHVDENGTRTAPGMALAFMNFKKLYDENAPQLGPYFRTLYQVLKHITFAPKAITPETKIRYAKLLRAQLGERCVFLFAINAEAQRGSRARPYIEAYGLLEHMDEEYRTLAQQALLSSGFDIAAFRNPDPTRVAALACSATG